MKLLKLLSISILFSLSSLHLTANVAEIKMVETNLRGSVVFAGDKFWNIESRMQHYGVPGVSIAVIKDYKIHWVKHYGVRDKTTNRKVDGETLFQAGSISKPVAAYGALKLVEDKKLSLDSPVNNQLRDWKLPENRLTKSKPVTLKQLLSHSAGVTVSGFPGYSKGEAVPSINQILNGVKPANTAAIRVDMAPETQFRYSGGGYTVVQKLVSDVTQKDYPTIMDQMILNPLSMTSSTFEQPLQAEKFIHTATGYRPNGKPVKGQSHAYPAMAAAGLWTTAEDLAKFAIDVQLAIKSDKSRVLSQSMVNTMLTPFVSDSMGLGFRIEKHNQELFFRHGGLTVGFRANLIAHQYKGYGVVVMTNTNHQAFNNELINSVASVYKWDDYLQFELEALPISLAEKNRISGRYRYDAATSFTIFSENNRIFMQYDGEDKMEVFRIGDNQYIRRESPLKFRFEKLKGDKYVSLVFGVNGETEYVRKRLSEN